MKEREAFKKVLQKDQREGLRWGLQREMLEQRAQFSPTPDKGRGMRSSESPVVEQLKPRALPPSHPHHVAGSCRSYQPRRDATETCHSERQTPFFPPAEPGRGGLLFSYFYSKFSFQPGHHLLQEVFHAAPG